MSIIHKVIFKDVVNIMLYKTILLKKVFFSLSNPSDVYFLFNNTFKDREYSLI